MEEKYKIPFEPMRIGTVEVKNRFFMAPMATTAEADESNCYTPRNVAYYVERARVAGGLIITGQTLPKASLWLEAGL